MNSHNPRIKAWQNGYHAGLKKKPYTPPNYRGPFGQLMKQSYLEGYQFAPKVLAHEKKLKEKYRGGK